MKALLCAALIALLASPVSAGGERVYHSKVFNWKGTDFDVVVPADSPLHLVRIKRDGQAIFKGRIVLRGTYQYGHLLGDDGPATDLDIEPDPETLTHLPYFVFQGGDPQRALTVSLSNGKAFARVVLSQEERARMRKDAKLRASGRVAVWVDRFVAYTGDCGGPYFFADFVSLYQPAPVQVARNDDIDGC